ncbi:MAG: symmetrical bis(5'-nucleosyl)-tetraphosphatase [Betaproteobacteria bacterium]|nr:symmetrical bis(5'-nucleosyl)-tetraphosphatase [Betaproteobacteria bacterium]
MATYAIGDIQGCFATFLRLLAAIDFNPERDRLWLTGDLVNRGPSSLKTLRYVKSLGDAVVTVLGNHDLYLLRIAEGAWVKRSRDDTLQEVLDAPDREELLAWLRHQSLCHVEGDYCLVHAGLLPEWGVKKARALAGEVEAVLQGDDYQAFLSRLWGSEPNAWSNDLEGIERLRVIVNAMTRMRFCTLKGEMNFVAKGGLDSAPEGCMPWFSLPGRKSAKKILITGHWSALGLVNSPSLLALDTGCLWGGTLTAVCLEDRKVFQVENKAENMLLEED